MLGGGHLKVSEIDGQFSRSIHIERLPTVSRFLRDHLNNLTEMYPVHWKAEGDRDVQTISQILQDLLEKDGCPDVFLTRLTILVPWIIFDNYAMENREILLPFIYEPHPFKPSTWRRLKSNRFPSFPLYVRFQELRKRLSKDLDDETRKRWRDIILMNKPQKELSNQEIEQIFRNQPWCILLKESKGKFTLMEVDESREA